MTRPDRLLVAVALRLYPRLAQLDNARQIPVLLEMIPILLTAPFALLALAGLAMVTRLDLLPGQAAVLLIALGALVLIQRRPFTLHVELETGRDLPLFGSLAEIVSWSAALILGPNALWAPVAAAIVESGWLARQRLRFNEDALLASLSYFAQTVGGSVLAALAGLAAYGIFNGHHPFASAIAPEWGAAFAATLISTLLPGLVLLPSVVQINSLVGAAKDSGGRSGYWIGLFLLPLVANPFGLLGALLYARAGVGAFLFFVLGVVLVNLLAYYLSRASERNQQHSRELARLEALGEALLQAPAAFEALPDLLMTHVGRMFFPSDRVAICLFGSDDSVFRLSFPPAQPPFPESVWERLRETPGSFYAQREVTLPGTEAAYGDAVAVKIVAARPGEESAPVCIGGIYLVRHRLIGRASESLAVVQSLASQIASALYRIQAQAEALAFQKVTQELEFAGRIQSSFLPEHVPQVDGWQIAVALEAARQTSGDFYDFIKLDDGRLGFLVADVSDKGMGAALYMALCRTVIRTYAHQFPADPERVLQSANLRILADTRSEQFATVLYAVLDTATGILTYSSAGHNPAYLLRADGSLETLTRSGMPLGVLEEASWRNQSVELQAGDLLLLYTDGLVEAQDGDGRSFDADRLLGAARPAREQPAQGACQAVLESLHRFVGPAPQFDDVTLLVIKRDS